MLKSTVKNYQVGFDNTLSQSFKDKTIAAAAVDLRTYLEVTVNYFMVPISLEHSRFLITDELE